jgi:hypothetical protein
MSDDSRAVQESHCAADEETYFDARPQIDSNDRRRVFEAGHKFGYEAARANSEAEVARWKEEALRLGGLNAKNIAEANAKNAELLEQMGMMRKALKAGKDADAYCEKYHHLGPEAAENCAEAQQSAEELVEQAINATAETVQAYRAECDRNAKVEVLRDAQTIIADQLKSDGYAAFQILEQMASNIKHDEEQGK